MVKILFRKASPTWLKMSQKGVNMLYTVFVVLLVLWLLGVTTSYTAGGLIHALLVVALVVLLVRLLTGRRAV